VTTGLPREDEDYSEREFGLNRLADITRVNLIRIPTGATVGPPAATLFEVEKGFVVPDPPASVALECPPVWLQRWLQ
jgi:hypothetical protein